MSFFHKKKASTKANAANVHMTEAEAALAQSDFNIDKILDIQNKFTGGTALLVPGRIFIREGMLWKACRKGPKKRQFFLFNDILVYGSVVAGRYSNQHVLPLAHMTVSGDPTYQPETNTTFNNDSLDEQLDIHNAFQISHANKSFHVFSLSQADKANWLANLQKHINKVALVGGNQTVSPRAVWVPDSHSKDCMVCSQRFTAFNRKHHCRQCGRVVCSTCSPHRVIIDGHADGKPERVCNGCVKDMSVVKSKGSPESIAKPPPAAVAAQLVSNALRHNSEHHSPGHQRSPPTQRQRRDSTDTEDSDDSEREEDTPPSRKKPTPVPRRTQSESVRHTASTGYPTTGPPQRPPPFGSIKKPPVKSEPQVPTLQRESPKPKPRTRKPEQQSASETVTDDSCVGEERESVLETVGERRGAAKSAIVSSDDPQPTPPPRKRKREKVKKQLEQQLQEQLQVSTPGGGEQLVEGEGGEVGETVEREGEEREGGDVEERGGESEGVREGEGEEGEVQEAGKVEGLEVVEAMECVEGGREGGSEREVVSGDVVELVEGEGVVAVVPPVPEDVEVESEEVATEVRSGEEVTVVPGDGEEVTVVPQVTAVPGDGEEVTVVPGVVEEVTVVPGDVEEVAGDEEEVTVVPGDVEEVAGDEEVTAVPGDEEGMTAVPDDKEVTTVPGDGEEVTDLPGDEEWEGDVDAVTSVEGKVREAPKRPRRRKKHFKEQDSDDQETNIDSDPGILSEATPTDSTHTQSDSLADQDTDSTQKDTVTLADSDDTKEELTENETVHEITGQPISGQLSGQPSDTTDDEVPIKKPRGRRPKFKPAES